MKLFIVLLATSAFAQTVPSPAEVLQLFYDGSGNLQYVCSAPQFSNRTTSVQRGDSTLTNIIVATNVGTVTTASAHGLWVGARVTVSGSTTAALNGTYTVASAPSSTAYTIATAGVPDATYNNAAMVITTANPLLTRPVWGIQVLTYTGTTLNGKYWAASATGGLACSNRALY